jgi:hypothetical protein
MAQYILRAPFSQEKMIYRQETKTVLYRSKMNPVTKRNFAVFPVLDWIAALTVHIHLLFHLGGRAPFRCQSNVGECGIRRGPMPMFLFRRNVHDIADADDLLVRFRGDDTLAGSDKKHLIAAMDVHFVPRTGTEIDDGKIEVVAHLRRQQRLSRHGTAREQGTIRWFRGNRVGFKYLH